MKKYILGYAIFTIVMLVIGVIIEFYFALKWYSVNENILELFKEAWQLSVFLPSFPLLVTFALCLAALIKKCFFKNKSGQQFTMSQKLEKSMSALKVASVIVSLLITYVITIGTIAGVQSNNFERAFERKISFIAYPTMGAISGLILGAIIIMISYVDEKKNSNKL